MSKTLMVMAGGTGGHVYPAMAVADSLLEKGWQIVWLCTEGGMENRLITDKPYEKRMITMKGVRGNGLLGWLKLPMRLFVAFKQAMAGLRQTKPNVVLGMGGFAAFPGGIMAKLLRIPLVIHEQNSVAGLTNKLLAKVANVTLAAFPSAFGEKAQLVGNPVRQNIVNVAAPAARFEGRSGPLRVLVVGGSLGAKALNELLPEAISGLNSDVIEVMHQAGEKHITALEAAYAQAQVNVKTVAFIQDMAAAYSWADLVICRSGALTVAELSAAGVASVLVPFPFAVDDHQTGNGQYLVENDAALMLQQKVLTVEKIKQLILKITRDECLDMAKNALALGKPMATQTVAQICEEAAK